MPSFFSMLAVYVHLHSSKGPAGLIGVVIGTVIGLLLVLLMRKPPKKRIL